MTSKKFAAIYIVRLAKIRQKRLPTATKFKQSSIGENQIDTGTGKWYARNAISRGKGEAKCSRALEAEIYKVPTRPKKGGLKPLLLNDMDRRKVSKKCILLIDDTQ